jgi:hypothetical protein
MRYRLSEPLNPMALRTKRIRIFLSILFSLAGVFSFFLQTSAQTPEDQNAGQYQRLIQLYSECVKLEEANFSKLTFELCPRQLIKTGSKLKLTLVDNFGRVWIFKPTMFNSGKEYRSTVGYRIYKLFGLDCPETHVIRLMLNGKEATGSIQRYWDNVTPQYDFPQGKVGPGAIKFLLKVQVLDWLLRDYDARFENFLILSQEGKNINKLCRIDLELILEQENNGYDYDYMFYLPPKRGLIWRLSRSQTQNWFKPERIYYYWLAKEYESKKIDVDWRANYSFVEFVADIPEDFLRSQLLPIKTRDFKAANGFPAGDDSNPGNRGFLDPVIEIKREMKEGFSKYYDRLAVMSQSRSGYSSEGRKKEIENSCDNLSRRIKELKAEEKRSKNLIPRQSKIVARVSLEAFEILYHYRQFNVCSRKNNSFEFDQAWGQMSRLEDEVKEGCEKEAIRYYKKQMLELREDKLRDLTPTVIDDSLL